MRARYFGPRTLDIIGDAVSAPSTIFSVQFTGKLNPKYALTLEALNIFNAQADDVEYYYGSWLPGDAANPANANDPTVNPTLGGGGVNDYYFHPSELRSLRLLFTVRP